MSTLPMEEAVRKNQLILKFTFGLVPVAAGADKFINRLADWEVYLHPAMADMLPFSADVFMMIVGVIEILAGIIVLTRPRVGAYLVSAWLLLIALNLLFSGQYLDVAVRDIVMSISAYVLARLSEAVEAPVQAGK